MSRNVIRSRSSTYRSPRSAKERNDNGAIDGSCRPPTHARAKDNSSRRRCTRWRSEVSIHRIRDHARGCSKYPSRHSSRSSLMAASLDRRAVISALIFCRSTLMSVAPALRSRFGIRRRPPVLKKALTLASFTRANAEPMPAGGAWGRRVLIGAIRTQAVLTVRTTHDAGAR